MGKQQTLKPRRGRSSRSPDKVPVKKGTGFIDKFVTSKLEKSITSVKVKKEKLEEKSNDMSVSAVTPDKAKPRRSKMEKRTKSPIRDNKSKPDFSDDKFDEDIQHGPEDLTQTINKDNIFQYFVQSKMGQLLSLPLEQMRHVVKVWKQRQNDSNPNIVKSMNMETLMLDIEEAKEESMSEQKREILRNRIKNEVREDLERIQAMNLTKSSNLAEIEKFGKEELCTFIRYMNKDRTTKVPYASLLNMPLDDIHKRTYKILQEMTHTQFDNSNKNAKCNITVTDIDKPDKEQEVVIDLVEENTMKIDQKQPETNIFTIDAELSDKEIMKADIESLKKSYHQYTIETGVPIQYDTIDLWPKSVLREIIKSKRDIMMSQQPKSKKANSILKQKGKYSGKKLTQTNLIHRGKVLKTCRYSLAFTIPDEYKGTEGLRRYFVDIFSEMVNYADEGFCLLPWDSDAITEMVTEPDEIPDRITDIKKYFNGARSPESSIYIYTKIRLGFPIRSDKTNFDADIQGWCKNRSIRFYVCSVQHPNVRSCGWLAYMPRTVNQEKWCQAIKQLYDTLNSNKTEDEFQIGLTWRVMNGQRNIDKKDKLRAMHIDAPVEIATRVKRFLRALSSKKKWVLGVKYRVMDEFHQYMKPAAKQKYRYMVTKHRAMMKQLAVCDCTQIINLDKKIGESTMTVRDIVVNIRDHEDNFRVFASIDEKWNSDTLFTATYRPDKATKAYDYMRSLATYVQYLFPDASLKRIFTLDAIEKAKTEKYDPTTQTFITQDDTELDQEIKADMDDDSMGFLDVDENLVNPFEFDESIKLVGGNSVWNFQGDDETVSTNASSTGGISFNSAHLRYYDTKSCASSVASSAGSKESENSNTNDEVPQQIQQQLHKLTATHSIAEEEKATDDVADSA